MRISPSTVSRWKRLPAATSCPSPHRISSSRPVTIAPTSRRRRAGRSRPNLEARNTGDRTDTTATVWLGAHGQLRLVPRPQVRPDYTAGILRVRRVFQRPRRPGVGWEYRIPGPIAVIADTPAVQARIDRIAAEVSPLEAALTARVEHLVAAEPLPKLTKKPITYEVIWAEDSDLVTPADLRLPARAGGNGGKVRGCRWPGANARCA